MSPLQCINILSYHSKDVQFYPWYIYIYIYIIQYFYIYVVGEIHGNHEARYANIEHLILPLFSGLLQSVKRL